MPPDDDKKVDDKGKPADDKQADDKSKQTNLDALTPQQQKQVFAYLLQQNETLRRELATLNERVAKPPEDKGQSRKDDDTDNLDDSLETMSRAKFAKTILKHVEDRVARPLLERLGTTEVQSERAKAEAELRDVVKENPDFWEFQTEVKAALEKNPALTVGEALILARHSSPEKTKALQEKREKEEGEKKVNESNKKRERFGGLFPTSGKTAASHKMNAKDAAESAWESTGASEHLAAIGE